MTELYDTTYPPKAAIIDGLLYAETYLFVGAPKIGKSFFMAQLSYHVATGATNTTIPLPHPPGSQKILHFSWVAGRMAAPF